MRHWMAIVAVASSSSAGAAPTPVPARLAKLPSEITALAFSPDGRLLAVGTRGCDRLIWDTAGDRFTARHREIDYGPVTSLRFSPGGRSLLLTSVYFGSYTILADGRLIRPTSRAATSPKWDGPFIHYHPPPFIADVRSVRVSDLNEIAPYAADISPPTATTFAPSGDAVLAIESNWMGGPESLCIRKPGDVTVKRLSWDKPNRFHMHAEFTQAGDAFVALRGGRIETYETGGRSLIGSIDLGAFGPYRLSISPDGRAVACLGEEKGAFQVRFWDQKTGAHHSVPLPFNINQIQPVAFIPGRTLAAVGHYDGPVLVHDWSARKTARHLLGPKAAITALAASPDGAWLYGGCKDGTLWRWRLP